jgi:hypothetical protein
MIATSKLHRFGLLVMVALLCLCVSACGSKLTSENFMKIKPGMTEKEVTDILGDPKEKKDAEGGTKEYIWESGKNKVEVKFKDGKVVGQRGNFSQ